MSSLNPNYNTTPLHSARNSRIHRRNSDRISLSSDWRRHFVSTVPTSRTTPANRIAWFPANNSIGYIQMCHFMVCERMWHWPPSCAATILLNPKNSLSLCWSTCIIYTTMFTTEIPRHSSGITYHCHKKWYTMMDAQIDLSTSSFCTSVNTTQKKYDIAATANETKTSHQITNWNENYRGSLTQGHSLLQISPQQTTLFGP